MAGSKRSTGGVGWGMAVLLLLIIALFAHESEERISENADIIGHWKLLSFTEVYREHQFTTKELEELNADYSLTDLDCHFEFEDSGTVVYNYLFPVRTTWASEARWEITDDDLVATTLTPDDPLYSQEDEKNTIHTIAIIREGEQYFFEFTEGEESRMKVAVEKLAEPPRNPYTVIRNINVIETRFGLLLEQRDVVLKDSIIDQVAAAGDLPVHPRAVEVDGTNRYLMCGLWDMHFHLCWEEDNDSLLLRPLLEHGITGVRDMGGDLRIQRQLKERIAADPTAGPQIVGAGPIIDGNPPVFPDFTIALDGSSEVEAILDSVLENGADFIKTYSLLKEPELKRIAAYADAHEVAFAGHLSEYVEPEVAIALGQKSLEHLNRLDDIWIDDPVRMDSLIAMMTRQETYVCPTLLIYDLKARMRDSSVFQPNYDALVHPMLVGEWEGGRARRIERNSEKDWAVQATRFEQQKALVKYLNQRGVNLMAGSDYAGMPYVYPAIGLHQELQLLHKAGLPNDEILRSATYTPAQYLGLDATHGTIEKGKVADLLILRKNPLEDLSHLLTIESIYRQGKQVQITK